MVLHAGEKISLTTISAIVIAYVLALFFLHKLVEKFFRAMFFVVSALFALGLGYYFTKGLG